MPVRLRALVLGLFAVTVWGGCDRTEAARPPGPRDIAGEVAAFYARAFAGPHRLVRTELLALDEDPADAGAWVAVVAVKGTAGAGAFVDTLEVAIRPGADRAWASEVRPLPELPMPACGRVSGDQ